MYGLDKLRFDTWAELVEYLSTLYPSDALAAEQLHIQQWGNTTDGAHLFYLNGARDFGSIGNLYYERGWMDEAYNLSQGFNDAVNAEYVTPEWASLGLPRTYGTSDFAGKTYDNVNLQLGGSAETSGGSITTMSSSQTSESGSSSTITKVMEVVKEEDPLEPGTFSYIATLQALGWLKLPTWTAAVAPALGVAMGYGMYETSPDFWDGLAQKLAPYSYHDLSLGNVLRDIIRLPIVYDPRTQTVLTSLKLIQALKDFFIEEGVYASGDVEEINQKPESFTDVVLPLGRTRTFSTAVVNGVTFYYDPNSYEQQENGRSYIGFATIPEYATSFLVMSGSTTTLSVVAAYRTRPADPYVRYFLIDQNGNIFPRGSNTNQATSYTYDEKTVYIRYYNPIISAGNTASTISSNQTATSGSIRDHIAWLLIYGTAQPAPSGVPGMTPEPGATYPTPSGTIPEDYPDWADDSRNIMTDPTAGNFEDGTEKFYPISLSDTNNSTNTDDTTSTKNQEEAQEDNNTEPSQLQQILEAILDLPQTLIDNGTLNPDTPTNPPSSEDTPTPTPPVITGAGSDLIAIYNPTKAQLQAFNQFLWSLDPTQLVNWKKVIQNPIDAIISLHMIYVTPSTGSAQNIKCGYIETNVASAVVTDQYVDIDCGSVSLNEFFYNIWDYVATEVQLFLPFIGIVSLDVHDVMGSSINVKYRVDVFTGTCLAQVIVTKEGVTACLYTYAGNCSVELPLSGGSFSVIASSLITLATSAVAGGISGVAGAAVSEGIAYAKGQRKQSISRSGNISANAGAMGIRKPYLIITRNKPLDAYLYQEQYGYPANATVSLGSVRGYTRVKSIHLSGIPCTDDELEMIESLLKEGVIIN